MSDTPVAQASLLIRRPAAELFDAFVEPHMLTRFWLSAASGPLEIGKRVRWEFMVPGAVVATSAVVLQPSERIEIEWSDGTHAVWRFESVDDGTIVRIDNWGFKGATKEVVATALEATQGFTIVLCDLKTLLETGRSTNLVRDKALQIQRKQSK
jgi:uncharacterized protein YndB with AHSA1/START domain